jgi:serine phosphatase RsbU (regulator of sigma subunit)
LPVLTYEQNSVSFAYAALYFNFTPQNEYSYRLDGYDKEWSKWTNDTKKEYTNLPEGSYVFWVKARNIYGQQSNIAKYRFKILPPWHRTWWAKILYVISAFITLYGGVKLYTLRLQKQKTILEHKVMVRTQEVVTQKEKIEAQNEVLQQKSEEIMAQNDSLKQKSEEITAQNIALQRQSEEILAQRNAIEATNQMLHVQNNQITQSIRSAETIQAAILPFEDRLKALFDDYFILFRPRDVVSGDFYYLEQIGDTTIVAAIDCTGHGVPGAFMSLIGYALLNEIVYAQHKTDPAEILEALREEVRHALKQEQTKHQHGMDVTMATISPSGNELINVVFAGAKRPLWYISPHEAQLQVVKGSNVSIGIEYRKKRSIVNTTLQLPKDTILYLGSDGFADQNDEQREKFGTHRLQDLLTQHYHLPLPKQQELLAQALDNFMTGTEQRDDILLMGVKV